MSSPPVHHPFVVLMVSFATQKLFNLMSSHLFIFCFVALARGDMFKKIWLRSTSKSSLPMFSSWSFMVSNFTFKPRTYPWWVSKCICYIIRHLLLRVLSNCRHEHRKQKIKYLTKSNLTLAGYQRCLQPPRAVWWHERYGKWVSEGNQMVVLMECA